MVVRGSVVVVCSDVVGFTMICGDIGVVRMRVEGVAAMMMAMTMKRRNLGQY